MFPFLNAKFWRSFLHPLHLSFLAGTVFVAVLAAQAAALQGPAFLALLAVAVLAVTVPLLVARRHRLRQGEALSKIPGLVYTARYDRDGVVAIDWVEGGARQLMAPEDPTTLRRDELLARYHPEDVHHFSSAYSSLADSGQARIRARLRMPGGTWTWIEHRITVLNRGDVLSVGGLKFDVTPEAAAAPPPRRAPLSHEDLPLASQLAAGVAHDFNNILGAIIGYGEITLADLPKGHHVQEYASRIISSGRRGAVLVNRLLAFTGQSKGPRATLDLREMVAQTHLDQLAAMPPSILWNTDLQPVGTALACREELATVIGNLCANARDAVGGRGIISLALHRANLGSPPYAALVGTGPGIERSEDEDGWGRVTAGSLEAGTDYAVLTVEDRGEGMPGPVQARLFTPFFSTRGAAHGGGLGLAEVFGIVKSHQGAILVSTKEAQGTRVEVLLPLAEA